MTYSIRQHFKLILGQYEPLRFIGRYVLFCGNGTCKRGEFAFGFDFTDLFGMTLSNFLT